jgi:hypothetical protein
LILTCGEFSRMTRAVRHAEQGPERKEPGRLKCYVLEQVSKSTEEMDGCVWK